LEGTLFTIPKDLVELSTDLCPLTESLTCLKKQQAYLIDAG
jgi:hypothetical protein